MNIIKTLLLACIFCTSLQIKAQNPHEDSGLKKVIVQEILQVESYTYLYVLEDGVKKWLAAPKQDAKLGEVFYYKGGMSMPNFRSNELDRTFDEVIFLSNITSENAVDPTKGTSDPSTKAAPEKAGKKPTLAKLELSIDKIEDGISIETLLMNPENFKDKKVKIKGEVTKFTGGIMSKNWVHFQDGTIHEGAYDLMITTQEELLVGDVVVFEGVISLNKDFGAGYFYKVIMEEALIIK